MVTWDDIVGWVNRSQPESETLDFKAAFWPEKGSRPRSEEVAKDVAALLNHRGGVIAVGVTDAGDRAGGFGGAGLPDHAEQIVIQALEKHLVPREAGGAVHAHIVTGVHEGQTRTVLVVDVRGWPHGPVAVRREGGLYQLPVRRGIHTVDLPWEEAMRDLTASHRRNLIRFQEWREKHAHLGVFLASAVRAVGMHGRELAVPLPGDEPFAQLGKVDQDVVYLKVLRTGYVRHLVTMQVLKPVITEMAASAPPQLIAGIGDAIAKGAWNNASEVSVPLPFELVRAAWIEESRGARLHLLLDATLVFAGDRWFLRPEVT